MGCLLVCEVLILDVWVGLLNTKSVRVTSVYYVLAVVMLNAEDLGPRDPQVRTHNPEDSAP